MFKGFYNLTSGMLSQGRRIDVVANNMTNVGTAGYKADRYADSTFQSVLISRVGRGTPAGGVPLGEMSHILAPAGVYTDYNQGALEETGMVLDFAIEGEGFFAVQTDNGVAYTRGGSLSLDDAGFLCMPGQGRVMGPGGDTIQLSTDQITADGSGRLYTAQGGYLGQLGVFTFEDNAQLTRNDQGLFDAGGAQATPVDTTIRWKMLERSNVGLIQQMTEMMSSQRAFQSAAQISKMYDQLMTKATTELGRL